MEIKRGTSASVPFTAPDDDYTTGLYWSARILAPGETEFATPDNDPTEIGEGLYEITLSTAETATAGQLIIKVASGEREKMFAVDILPNLQSETHTAVGLLPTAATIATAVWAAASRTLTAVADSTGITTLLTRLTATRAGYLDNLAGGSILLTSPSIISAGHLYARPGDDWSFPVTGLGSLTDIDDLLFVIKASPSDPDSSSLLTISQLTGLSRITGTAVDGADTVKGDLTIDDEDDGDITVTLEASFSISLTTAGHYAIKRLADAATRELASGRYEPSTPFIRRTS